MPEPLIPIFVADLRQVLQIPETGIASRILQDDEASKVILLGLATGYEMKLHAAPVPTILYFVEGEATLTLGDEKMTVRTGALAHLPSHLKHAIAAGKPVLMLLIMVK